MGNIFQCKFILCEHCCCYSGCGKEKEIVTHVDTSHRKWIDSKSGNYIESHQVIKNFLIFMKIQITLKEIFIEIII